MPDPLNDREALAAEYALGILDLAERRRVQSLLARDADFARLVDQWEARLAPLADAIPAVEPPEHLLASIQGQLGSAPVRTLKGPAGQPRRRGTVWQSLAFWRWMTAGAAGLAAAAMVLAIVIAGTAPPGLGDRYVAVLSAGAAEPALMVTIDPSSYRMTIRPLRTESRPDRTLELWLVAGDDLPQSLGLLDPSTATSLQIAPAVEEDVGETARLAVSLEPEGGSPTGLPTGPVVYQGPILPLRN